MEKQSSISRLREKCSNTVESIFHVNQNGSTVRTEITAGITSFMTMAYILAVNPSILSSAGMDRNAVFVATALSAAIGTLIMAFIAKYPFALAPGMGLNAYFTYTVCIGMDIPWQAALAAVFIEGLIFIGFSLFSVREEIFNAIPQQLKTAISAGIGLFIAFIGFQNANIIVGDSSTDIALFHFAGCNFKTEGITVILALIGICITSIFLIINLRGAILWGILATWLLGMACEALMLYVPDPSIGAYSVIPLSIFSVNLDISPTFMQFWKFSWSSINLLDFATIVFAFLCIDTFDTVGTVTGCAKKADMLDKDGNLPRLNRVLLADAIATSVGACLGTSTTTTFVESASGIEEGGRTGLTAFTTGILFVLALIFSPIFLSIPSFATAPALIIVGCSMMKSVKDLLFNDLREFIPACLCMFFMVFSYSIANGIAAGFISYVIINLFTGRGKKVHWIMYAVSILFMLKYALI